MNKIFTDDEIDRVHMCSINKIFLLLRVQAYAFYNVELNYILFLYLESANTYASEENGLKNV